MKKEKTEKCKKNILPFWVDMVTEEIWRIYGSVVYVALCSKEPDVACRYDLKFNIDSEANMYSIGFMVEMSVDEKSYVVILETELDVSDAYKKAMELPEHLRGSRFVSGCAAIVEQYLYKNNYLEDLTDAGKIMVNDIKKRRGD